MVSGTANIVEAPGGIGSLNATCQRRDLEERGREIETESAEIDQGQRERREACREPVSHQGAVAPLAVSIVRDGYVFEGLGPGALVLEYGAAPRQVGLSPLVPAEEIVSCREMIADPVVERARVKILVSPGSLGLRQLMMSVVAVEIERVVFIGSNRTAQEPVGRYRCIQRQACFFPITADAQRSQQGQQQQHSR